MRTIYRTLATMGSALLLASCGGDTDVSEFEVVDNSAEVAAYYTAKPEFFAFKTLADVPTDLSWEDGSHLQDIGSDEAVKGGTLYNTIQDFPRTLRQVGPDSNGSFRPFILD